MLCSTPGPKIFLAMIKQWLKIVLAYPKCFDKNQMILRPAEGQGIILCLIISSVPTIAIPKIDKVTP